MKKTTLCYLSILIIFLGSSCVNLSKVKMLQKNAGNESSQQFANEKASMYKLNSGDYLYIRVTSTDAKTSKFFQADLPTLMNPTFSNLNSYRIDTNGDLTFSFIDKINVKGLTVLDAQKMVQEKLNQYFKDCSVYIRLVNFQVTVLGEVEKPGAYQIDKEELTIFQAIGLAGGTNMYGNLKKVKLIRKTLTGSDVHYIDLNDTNILQSEFYYILPDDVIYIEPRGAKVWASKSFPYQALLSIASISIALLAIFIK
ncbi:MAG: polysaccharide biosynthesis/export family protein [Bacteroidales bacterium]|nr:polysaccharide biosynthesis/export family protein [Bacteroidales bacterium]